MKYLLSCILILSSFTSFAAKADKNVLLVVTNHSELGKTGKKITAQNARPCLN